MSGHGVRPCYPDRHPACGVRLVRVNEAAEQEGIVVYVQAGVRVVELVDCDRLAAATAG